MVRYIARADCKISLLTRGDIGALVFYGLFDKCGIYDEKPANLLRNKFFKLAANERHGANGTLFVVVPL